MWMFGSRTTVKKVRNCLTWFSHFVENANNGLESVMATRFTLEMVCDLVTKGWWSEKREDPQ